MKGGNVISASDDLSQSLNGDIYGTSKYLKPREHSTLVAEAKLKDFAPCACVCCGCLVNDAVRSRTYVRAYENRLEISWPFFPCLCCTKERCIVDNIQVMYYDKVPSRSGMYCFFIPCTICGPPVLYTKVPKLCGCIDLRPCCGETINYHPANYYGLRCCLCVGTPCYESCSQPLVFALEKGSTEFLAKYKGALLAYVDSLNGSIAHNQVAVFTKVVDKFCDCDSAKEIDAIPIGVGSQVMERR